MSSPGNVKNTQRKLIHIQKDVSKCSSFRNFTSPDYGFPQRSKQVAIKYLHINIVVIMKGKAVPLQAWSGPEGSRKLRFPDSVTMAQDGGKVVSLMHRLPSPAGNTPGTHFC